MYCLKNWTATNENGSCFCRSQEDLIKISRLKFIGDYNDNMGIVDLEDMRRPHCNSYIMGLHQWWLKFLFNWHWNL